MAAPPIKDAAVYSDLSGLAALKRGGNASDPNTLRQVARQFESVFAKMMLTSMRQASSSVGDSLFGSDQTQFYQGMFDDQLSLELTKGRGLGLADLLVRQLQHMTGGTATDAKGDATKPAEDLKLPGPAPAQDLKLPAAKATEFAIKPSIAPPSEPVSTFRKPSSPEDFVQQLLPCAEQAGRELGVNPTHLLAQAALETGWGKSLPCDANGNPSFNFFGIKSGGEWKGDSVSVRTLEFEGGVPVPKQARFRSYDSAADSFRDYVALLRDNPRYAAALNTG